MRLLGCFGTDERSKYYHLLLGAITCFEKLISPLLVYNETDLSYRKGIYSILLTDRYSWEASYNLTI